jgi:hypothetical protein
MIKKGYGISWAKLRRLTGLTLPIPPRNKQLEKARRMKSKIKGGN